MKLTAILIRSLESSASQVAISSLMARWFPSPSRQRPAHIGEQEASGSILESQLTRRVEECIEGSWVGS